MFGPPSPERFAKRLAEALRRAGEPDPIALDRGRFVLRVGADEIALHTLYREYAAESRAGRRRLLERVAAARRGSTRQERALTDLAAARPRLVPLVRSLGYVAAVDTPTGGLPHRALAGNLVALAAVDLDGSTVPVGEPQLEAWRASFDEVMAIAESNLWRRSAEPPLAEVRPGVFAVPWADGYGPSRLVFPSLFWRLEVKGAPVVMAPNTAALLATGEADPTGLEALAEVAEGAIAHPRPLTGIALTPSEPGWRTWLPPVDAPGYAAFKRLALESWAAEYAAQHERLVASGETPVRYHAIEGEGGAAPRSYCVWEEAHAGPQLLPRTDDVHLLRTPEHRQRVLVAPWDVVASRAAGVLEAT